MRIDQTEMTNEIKIETRHLFTVLDKLLVELLNSLTEEEWQAQTVARLWKVKDVAAHLLDGNLRGLSISRDRYFGEKADNIHSYEDLVSFLNRLNLDWTNAAKRLSPRVLIELLEITGKQYSGHLNTLDPLEDAVFPVAWAGQSVSPNWFHIAREYTEKFLHQQQIRDAVNKPGILTKELFYPFIDTLMHALPYTFKDVAAPNDTVVSMVVTTTIGGQWNITRTAGGWVLNKDNTLVSAAMVTLDPNTAWKLFSKSWRPAQVMDKVEIKGDRMLAKQALQMVGFMA
jgi:hypothetical protein